MNERLQAGRTQWLRSTPARVLTAALVLSPAANAVGINGAGATFPEPLYLQMFTQFKAATGNAVSYEGVGSGRGQSLLVERKVDFGATDVPMTDDAMRRAGGRIVHIPTALGAVVPIYNLGRLSAPLRVNGALLADIFLGKIRTWDDPAIAKLNPGLALPKYPITVVHRAESSGTSYVFTDFLTKTSPDWASKIGAAGNPRWPLGKSIASNDELAETVSKTFGAIGYSELADALQDRVSYALVQNRAGRFVKPDVASVMAAAESADPDAETRYSITDAPAADAYPISTFTYVMVYSEQNYGGRSRAQALALRDLLAWMVTDGQKLNRLLNYAPLPRRIADQAQGVIDSLTYAGARLR